jgi:hypothetical protein
VQDTFIPHGTSEFNFEGLPAGTYRFEASGPTYLGGAYPKDVVLSAHTKTLLDPIFLQPRPIRLRNAKLSSNQIPAEGGSIDLTVDVVNETDNAQKNLKLVVNWWATRILGSPASTGTLVVEAIDPLNVEVEAHSVKTISVPLSLPKAAPNKQVLYLVSVSLANRTKFSPVTDRIDVGNVQKGCQSGCSGQQPPPSFRTDGG